MAFSTVSFLAATVLPATVGLSSAVPPARQDPSALLREARRSLHEAGDDSLLKSLRKRSSLWGARVALSRAGAAERSEPPARSTLGLPGVDEWLVLRNDPKADAGKLARFASTLPFGPVAIEATGEAGSRLRTTSERRLVHEIAVRLLSSGPYGPQTTTVLLMARLRAETDDAKRRATMAELVSAVPDALERDPLQKRGEPSARALFASLLPGTSSDVYGRWSADSLGVEPATASPVFAGEAPTVEDDPVTASREYLAAGLDGLAELAAESEGSLDRLFAARIASERGDYRRATSILKGLHPALGTPEEGGCPSTSASSFTRSLI